MSFFKLYWATKSFWKHPGSAETNSDSLSLTGKLLSPPLVKRKSCKKAILVFEVDSNSLVNHFSNQIPSDPCHDLFIFLLFNKMIVFPKWFIFHQNLDFSAIVTEFNSVLHQVEQDVLVDFEICAQTILTLQRIVNYLKR